MLAKLLTMLVLPCVSPGGARLQGDYVADGTEESGGGGEPTSSVSDC